ncbi:hypothetical protein SAMN04487897_12941 [Paenibacillus sp. yr247]|uniref:hypothetical protein n=1 Tax=Paenibacillus sp. yr247 TaxID=1761880 RepID=UPI000880D7FC|nr:hypothetical protein [Paenibacillus sp. yr247]SDO99231.1 hypothetical protein SAMN04487897_12941 [Paenibacillus sp. yr247]
MKVVYDNSFNANEWFVILSLLSLNILVFIIPKIFSLLEGTAHYIYGFYIGMFFDHTIGIRPWDFYDVNDTSDYQFIDFLSYFMFCPYSYFYIYLYEKLNIKGYMHLIYVLSWTCFSLVMEWIGVQVGLYHYDKGYKMYWSVPIYLLAESMQIIYYHFIKRKENFKRL